MIKKTLLLLMGVSAGIIADAQNIKGNVGIEDANRASATKTIAGADLVNVDLYTGTAGISIPIVNQEFNGVDVGVSVNYSAKGIQVDEIPSSVGLGFDLDAAGSITREVYGLEDEVTMPFAYWTGDSIQGYLVPGATVDASITDFDDDKEHDVFHASFGGRSVKIVFTYHSGALVYQTYPRSDIKIEMKTADWSGSAYTNYRDGVRNKSGLDQTHDILSFIITDESGNRYFFERGDYRFKPYSFSIDTLKYTGTYYPTTKWNLVKIRTATGLEVKYEYISKYIKYIEDVTETLYPKPQTYNPIPTYLTWDPLQIVPEYWEGYQSHISRIIFPNNTNIYFDVDTARCDCQQKFRLRNIFVVNNYDGHSIDSIKFQFDQALFNTPGSGMSLTEYAIPSPCGILKSLQTSGLSDSAKEAHIARGMRLKLKAINKKSAANTETEPYYTFEYNTTALPDRFSPHKDYYGYYNGKSPVVYRRENLNGSGTDSFYLSIPYHHDQHEAYIDYSTTYSDDWGLDRSHDISYAQASTLTKIKNCGGGSLSLYYRNYIVSNPTCSYDSLTLQGATIYGEPSIIYAGCTIDTLLQGDTVNDGLCIWKVVSSDGLNVQNDQTLEYTYENGERFNRGGYTWYMDETKHVFTNYYVSPMSFVHGSNHGFGKVTVTTKGYAGQQLAKTITTFTNLMHYDSSAYKIKSWMRKPTGTYWHTAPGDFLEYAMGMPLVTEDYDNNDSLIAKDVNTYEHFAHWLNDIRNWRFFNSLYWEYHIIDHECLRLKTTTSTKYISNKTLVEERTFDYDTTSNLKRTTWTDSKGSTFKQIDLYNYDYPSAASQGINRMNSNGLQQRVSTEQWKVSGSDSVLVGFSLKAPLYDSLKDTYTFPAYYQSMMVSPIASSSIFPINTSSSINRYHALNYLANNSFGGNLKQVSKITRFSPSCQNLEVKINNTNQYVSYIFDVDKLNRLAEAHNARYEDIAFTSFESLYTNQTSDSDYNKGNWDFDVNQVLHCGDVSLPASITGTYLYDLKNSNAYSRRLRHMRYVLSFWLNSDGVDPTVQLTNGSGTTTLTCTIQNTVGDWKLYSTEFVPDSGWYVHIIGATSGIIGGSFHQWLDEIRLHPVGASMETFTYYPLYGTNSYNNSSNYITYNEYDIFGRLKYVKDLRGNVIKRVETRCNSTDKPPTGGGGSEGPPSQGQ